MSAVRAALHAKTMKRIALILVLSWLPLTSAGAQTAHIVPSELSLIPLAGLGDDRYWQQLLITLAAADAPDEAAVSINLPPGLYVADTDGDSLYADEVRVVYRAVDGERPGFYVAPSTGAQKIVVGSEAIAAAGGQIYVQFPCKTSDVVSDLIERFGRIEYASSDLVVSYGRIDFADGAEADLAEGPEVSFVSSEDFSTLGSMQVVSFAPFLAAGSDTLSSPVGQYFPDEERLLMEKLPDLVFDGGSIGSSNMLGLGDGENGNDVDYRFFFSTSNSLKRVDATVAVEAYIAEGDPYVEREGISRMLRLDISGLAPGTYYLYVTAAQTGSLPLGRSRGISVRHVPQFIQLDPEDDTTLDSGGLYDPSGEANGNGQHQISITYSVFDIDDIPKVRLFYSREGELSADGVVIDGDGTIRLTNAQALMPQALAETDATVLWDVLQGDIVAQDTYYIYGVADDGENVIVQRSAGMVNVRHAPFLRLDPLSDRAHAGLDTIHTGGLNPQRYVTLSWGRSGIDGDGDLDSDAHIDLYYSAESAADGHTPGGFSVPAGADEMLTALNEGRAQLIFGNITEDPDRRQDNQYVWDLWSMDGDRVPSEGQVHYVYGLISDGENRRLAQMNGGHINDAGSQVYFAHAPSIFPLQPVERMVVGSGGTGRVAWQDVDLDDDARIRVLLSAADLGPYPLYDAVNSVPSYVVNSRDGRADIGVDMDYDLSEDSPVDHLDMRIDHLMRGLSTDAGIAEGEYSLYLAITDRDSFAGAQCWQVPGKVEVTASAETQPVHPIVLLPQQFSMANGGATQVFEVRIDAEAEVDLVQASFSLDSEAFAIVDQDTLSEGIQPFLIDANFSAAKLVSNRITGGDGAPFILTLEYFEPRIESIGGLGPDRTLVTFQVRSLDVEMPTAIELVTDDDGGALSRLEKDGVGVVALEAGVLSQGELIAGRATLRGILTLEGRSDMTEQATFSLRARGDYRPYVDELFVEANDVDPAVEGAQVEIADDGSFELAAVPAGRWDLHVHVDGYVGGVAADLYLYPNQLIEGIEPSSDRRSERPRLWGGDVVGYVGEDGLSVADNEVTLADWDYVAAFFGTATDSEDGSVQADITGDGRVDIADLSLVGANFLQRGAQPVYKSLESDGRVTVEYAGGRHQVERGDEITWSIRAGGAEQARAYALQLHYDNRAWEWVDMRPMDSTPSLSALSEMPYGILWGRVLVGRSGSLVNERGQLAEWTLRARVDNPAPPTIGADGFVDRADRPMGTSDDDAYSHSTLPQAMRLEQNIPNPFNPETHISFAVPSAGPVRLDIYNALGQRIETLWNGPLAAGHYAMQWNGRDQQGRPAASGVYIYRLESANQTMAKRMVLVR